MADGANVGGLGDAVESMKAKMKEAPPKAPPKTTEGDACPTWCGVSSLWRRGTCASPCMTMRFAFCAEAAKPHADAGSCEAGKLRGPAESLRFLADGAAAVRPATEAEEEIKRKEKLVRERMNKQVRLGLCPGGQMVQACARARQGHK